jgi:hypothetical protein
MPGRDKSGPKGRGAETGRGLVGPCKSERTPAHDQKEDRNQGVGRQRQRQVAGRRQGRGPWPTPIDEWSCQQLSADWS